MVIKILTELGEQCMNKVKISTMRKYKMYDMEIIELKNTITEPKNSIEVSTTD